MAYNARCPLAHKAACSASRRCLGVAFLAALGASGASLAAVPARQIAAVDLVELSLEQLADVVVTSVSRREERLADAAASIYVINGDDIRRSGATSLPEALRLAPNLDVARADVNQYAISARGFNNVLANKMLVLIDGRTVYTPLFSGVFWEAQDVMLEDVERIEVISGPGATLWGANAVNGVINVITRSSRDTHGVLASGRAGDLQSGAAVRYGGEAGTGTHYRVYAKYDDRDASRFANGASVHDASIHGQAGFRLDHERAHDTLTVQGDTYFGDIEQVSSERSISGANVLARYRSDLGEGRSLAVQAYYDNTHRDHPQSFREVLDTFDVEAQYGFVPLRDHKMLAGGGYRYARDDVGNSAAQAFLPAQRSLAWAHAFVQDEIALAARLDLTVGAKIERNPYTGGEFLPNVRLAWRYAPDRLLWGALSRAVRAPSRIDREFYVPGNAPYVLLQGDDAYKSEVSNVAELGHRSQPTPALSYSVTAFYHQHDRLRSYEPVPGHPTWGNRAEGKTYGVEGWATWRIVPTWRVSAGGVALRQRLKLEPGSLDPGTGIANLGNDPGGWWSVRTSFDITSRHEVDVAIRHVTPRPNPAVPAYTTVDVRLGWNVSPALQVSLVAQNAFEPSHPEWGPAVNRAEIQRSIFLKALWRL